MTASSVDVTQIVLAIFLIVFGYLALVRYLRYRETMELARRNLLHAQREYPNGKDTLRWGIAITAIGLALIIGLLPLGQLIDEPQLTFGPWMIVGLIPTFFGLALILIYVVTKEDDKRDDDDLNIPSHPDASSEDKEE